MKKPPSSILYTIHKYGIPTLGWGIYAIAKLIYQSFEVWIYVENIDNFQSAVIIYCELTVELIGGGLCYYYAIDVERAGNK